VRRRAPWIAVLAALVLSAVGTQALATINTPVVATNSSDFATNGAADQGTEGVFDNQDASTHNVTADANGPDKGPLFRTGNAPGETMRAIRGTQFLTVGSYAFTCTIHPSMQASFVIDDTRGTDPVPRPEISLKVKSKKLAKVVESGKLKVKVEAAEPTRAENIKLKAKKGKKGITKAKQLNLAAGGKKTVTLKLSDKGLDKLAGLESAKVKVEGTVDFGFGDKVPKKLK
jgi:plastocyanin